jgi:hypothetical protein
VRPRLCLGEVRRPLNSSVRRRNLAMPQTVKVSLVLLLVSYAGVLMFFPHGGRTSPLFVVWLALWIFILYRTYRGKNWGRWVLAAQTAFAWAVHIPGLATKFEMSIYAGFVDVIFNLGITVAIALLFTPTANRWYGWPRQHANAV